MDAVETLVRRLSDEVPWSLEVDTTCDYIRARILDRTIGLEQAHAMALAHACVRGDRTARDALVVLVQEVATKVRWPELPVDARAARIWEHVFSEDGNGRVRLTTYDGRGPLGAWLRVVATRLVQRDAVDPPRAPQDDALAGVWTAAAGSEHGLIKDMYVEQVRTVFRDATRSLSESARTLLHLHYVRGVSLERLTGVYGVHRVTLSRRLKAARTELLDRAVAGLRSTSDMTEHECRSLLRTLQSRIELSLGMPSQGEC